MYRMTEVKGAHIPFGMDLDTELRADNLFPENSLVDSVASQLPWHVVHQQQHRSSLHVNLRELEEAVNVSDRAAPLSLVPW